MAGDRALSRIRGRIRLIEHERQSIDGHVNRLLGMQAQLSSGELTPEQIPWILSSIVGIQARDIPSGLRWFARERSRLDGEEAMLRQRERARQLVLSQRRSAMRHGTPSSLAGASSSSEIETGAEQHVVELSSSELGGTSKDPILTLNDTPHTLESADGVPEHVEVSSSELGGTSKDLSKFEALTLNDTPHTLESADGVPEDVVEVSSSELGGTSTDLPKFETLTLDDTPHTLESADEQEILGDFYPLDHEGDIEFEMAQAEERAQFFQAQEYWPLDFETNREYADMQVEKQTQSVQARGQHTYASKKEEIAANAKRWMSEEAMVAFKRYIESKDDLKGLDYEFDELVHQCFNVEHYLKIFHHFNFTVKIKKPGSADWTAAMYFAEVKSICMIKLYACYPLEQGQYGQCYACENQGMGELRHPLKGIYDMGREDIQSPFYYEDSDSDEFDPATGRSESSDDDMS